MSTGLRTRGSNHIGAYRPVARRLGIDTRDEMIAFMRRDCPVCRSEGLEADARVELSHAGRSIVATLFQMTSDLLDPDVVGLSEAAWVKLGVADGDQVTVAHPRPLDSLSAVRGKLYGNPLGANALSAIITDVVAGRYADVHLASFVAACSARPMSSDETVALTRAMVEAGDRLSWSRHPIVDKHSVGGLPGNRTTPIVVAIVAALGLVMPKTSSRSITSPAGTADAMETMAPVALDLAKIREVVEREGGCIAWGGAVRLSPADEVLIRVERALDLDSEGQLVASVLSKKIAAGATHLVLDLPVGPTAKVRSAAAAEALSTSLHSTAAAFGIETRIIVSDGSQPVGSGIGPALEARDVLAVLKRSTRAPRDLRERALTLAGAVLELGGAAPIGAGLASATAALEDGHAWDKFQRICAAQGGMRTPPIAAYRSPVLAERAGRIAAIDNRRLARVAKLAGAPDAKAAGLELHVHLGMCVEADQPVFTIHAETPGELAYALNYVAANPTLILVEEA